MNLVKLLKLVAAIIACELIGAIGTIFTSPNIPTWYASLAKPFFAPPNWVFGPVWGLLFLLMGVSLFIIWEHKEKKNSKNRTKSLLWFAIQFIFNVLWSYLFFGLKSPFLGLVGIVILWLTIVATIIEFRKISRNASNLLIPYLLWVSFATLLNAAIWVMN